MAAKGDKHHYIPKFYLKRWAGANKQVCEFSRPYRDVSARFVHSDGTGFERGLYTVPGMPPDTMNLVEERFLKRTDNAASMALDDLTAERAFNKPEQRRLAWSRFIFSLLLRFPEAQRSMRLDLEDNVRKMVADTNEPKEVIEGIVATNDLDKGRAGIFLELLNNSRFTRTLFSMHWDVITVDSSRQSFLTSDRPVINTANGYGFAERNLAIPISPSKLFVASDSEGVFRALRSRPPNSLVSETNHLVVSAAVKYVWGNDASQMRFIENRLTESRNTPFRFVPLAS
jgi:hypothetical protein